MENLENNPPKENPGACNTEASRNNTPSKYVEIDDISKDQIKQDTLDAKTKCCSRCLTVKSVSKFAKNSKTLDGYLKTCFACSRPKNAVKRSLRLAINAKCRECIYDPIAGGGSWKQQVTVCSSPLCPLFEVRPTTGEAS